MTGNQILYILLSKDGTINRLGDGTLACKDHNTYNGKTQDKIFEKVVSTFSSNIFEHCGEYDIPEKKGKNCELKVALVLNPTS